MDNQIDPNLEDAGQDVRFYFLMILCGLVWGLLAGWWIWG